MRTFADSCGPMRTFADVSYGICHNAGPAAEPKQNRAKTAPGFPVARQKAPTVPEIAYEAPPNSLIRQGTQRGTGFALINVNYSGPQGPRPQAGPAKWS